MCGTKWDLNKRHMPCCTTQKNKKMDLVKAFKQGKPSSNPTPQLTPQPTGAGKCTGGVRMISITRIQGALAINRTERAVKSDKVHTVLTDTKKVFGLNQGGIAGLASMCPSS